jgi:restriction system protein
MITSAVPEDWRDLQCQVARILREVGMEVAVEKKLDTGRSPVGGRRVRRRGISRSAAMVDRRRVQALAEGRPAERHPQRSYGRRGDWRRRGLCRVLRRRAVRAVERTNVRLFTWEGFQAEFEQAWLKSHLMPLIDREMERLFIYTDPLVDVSQIGEVGVESYNALYFRYGDFASLMKGFTPAGVGFRGVPELPIRPNDPGQATELPASVEDAMAYREFAEAAIAHGESVIGAFYATLLEGGMDIHDAMWPPIGHSRLGSSHRRSSGIGTEARPAPARRPLVTPRNHPERRSR